MSNPLSEQKELKVRTTKVTKGINRKLWTAKYEEIEICSHVEEVIEWTTMEERQNKLDAITKCVVKDFEKTRDTVLEELGLSEKKAFVDKEEPTRILKTNQSTLKDVFDEL